MSNTSPLVRMIPLHPSELPKHSLLSSTDGDATVRPDLLPFTLALLDTAHNALFPMGFNKTFKSHSHKAAPPSNTSVEVLTTTFPSSELSQIKWSDPSAGIHGITRTKPREIPTEHWFARRSYHKNLSSKVNPATASWPEFVFGLRDNHSKNEAEFTPTLYDARHILDWNAELEEVESQWRLGNRRDEGPGHNSYSKITLAVYEMCHEIPFPLQPRCFPVIVAAASCGDNQVISATVPVNLSNFEGAFYSSGRNRTEGEDAMRRKEVVLGVYTAVEKLELFEKDIDGNEGGTETAKSDDQPPTTKQKEEVVEWIMGTASDAKGNLPMFVQRNSLPGEVIKDVGNFLKWIHTVDDEVLNGTKPQVFTTDANAKVSGERKRSRTGSTAR